MTHILLQNNCCTHFMPCWNTELRLVLQIMTSAHCTTTILTKKAVWHVNSTIFLCSYVWGQERTDREWDKVTLCKIWKNTYCASPLAHKDKLHIYPLLSIAVFQVVDCAVIPIEPDAYKSRGQETIFSQDDKVGEEASQSLDHTWGKTNTQRD